MLTITFLFPHPATGPTGGYKVVYEYANRLAADGHRVNIVYSGSIYWSKKSLYHKMTSCIRYVQRSLKGYSCRNWFPLDERVKEHFSLSLNYRHIPKSDIYVATSPYTAYYLNQYPDKNCRKYYFIQGYENWGPGLRAILFDTYHYPIQKIVVARWLQRMLKQEHNEVSVLIPNGFDLNRFNLQIPIENKDSMRISMLYHTMKLKDCELGFRALDIVKQQHPQLKVSLFGIPPQPDNLPSWYEYHQCPSAEEHNRLNNQAAIYIGTSQVEGWGLTVGEAMICGQAVCCTDNEGYKEMAIDGETALVSPVGDCYAMAHNIIRMIEDDELRFRIAKRGNRSIQQFSWDNSYHKLLNVLELQ